MWFNSDLDVDGDGNLIQGAVQDPHREGHVRVVFEEIYDNEFPEVIILDSGSDVSLLPRRFQADQSSSHRLHDCQGNALSVHGTKEAEVTIKDVHGEQALLKHQFVVGDVTGCLLSLGQLYKNGCSVQHQDDGDGLALVAPDN